MAGGLLNFDHLGTSLGAPHLSLQLLFDSPKLLTSMFLSLGIRSRETHRSLELNPFPVLKRSPDMLATGSTMESFFRETL